MIAGVVLLGIAVLVFGSHVRHGSFYYDDWSHASEVHFHGYRHAAVQLWQDVIPGRPVLALLLPLPFVLFGLDARCHLAMAIVLGGLTSLTFFIVLRALRVEFPHALALAVLSLLFPWSDALRLWPTASMNNIALIAYFLGTMTALHALGVPPMRRRLAIVFHVVAAALYLISVLTYEAAAAAILASGLLYRTRFSWRAFRTRWILDTILVLVPLTASLVVTSHVRHVGSPSQRVTETPHFLRDGVSILASMFVPQSVDSRAVKMFVLASCGAVVTAALVRGRTHVLGAPRHWLVRGAAGAAVIALGYVMFLGSGLFPLYAGVDDRANTFAAFGFIIASYSLVVLFGRLVTGGRRSASTGAIVAAGTVLIGIGFIDRVRADIGRYDRAAIHQREELALLARALVRPQHTSSVFVFGYPATEAPGVPIFWKPWDITGAIRLRWSDPSLDALPIYRSGISCEAKAIRALEFDSSYAVPYDQRVLFVDLRTNRVRRIPSRERCLSARTTFAPGPLAAG